MLACAHLAAFQGSQGLSSGAAPKPPDPACSAAWNYSVPDTGHYIYLCYTSYSSCWQQHSSCWGLSEWWLFLQEYLPFLQVWLSCTNSVRVHSVPSSRSFIKFLHSIGRNLVPWGTLLVTSCQLNTGPVTTPFKFPSLAAFHLSSSYLTILSTRILWETVSNTLLKSRLCQGC